MLEITIKGEPKELIEFFGTLEQEKSSLLIKEIAPLVAKRISISEIVRTESQYRDCTVAELADALEESLKQEGSKNVPTESPTEDITGIATAQKMVFKNGQAGFEPI